MSSDLINYSNVPQGAEALLLAGFDAETILHISVSDREMNELVKGLNFFAPSREIIEFPAWDTLPYDRSSPNPIIISRRVEALTKLLHKQSGKRIIATTINAVLQKIPAPEVFKTSALVLQKNAEVLRDDVLAYLQKNGYERVSKVIEPGEYAVRGSIIDLFPSGYDDAIRIDYFGDEIETIKSFDPLTQSSIGELPRFQLLPASEIIYADETREKFREQYRKTFGAVTKEDPLYEAITAGVKYPGMENWLPLFYDKLAMIFDYLPSDTLLVFDHLTAQAEDERFELIADYFDARKTNASADYKALPSDKLYLAKGELAKLANNFNRITFNPFTLENSVDSGYRKAAKPGNDFEKLKEFKKQLLISAYSKGSLEHISGLLKKHNLKPKTLSEWSERAKLKNEVGIFTSPIEEGFQSNDFVIISEQDIFGDRFIRTTRKKKSAEKLLAEAASFAIGDLIVHEDHGIGKFSGLETLVVSGIQHDMVKLVYDGEARLFVPVENLEIISRYGGDTENVRLDKLGGVFWQERKSRLKERIRLAADALLKIAAERALKTATRYNSETGSYSEFTAKFPYNETEDQLRAIEDVFADLSSGKPMDRLICGDVGFGKTEVALRAAFVVAQGAQIAIICPTTLLARQHYQNFKTRFEGFPIVVRQLSRMVTAAEAKKTKAGMALGEVDIVIGTHALLAEDVAFKNLGLVIIDEEQHFGVAQKERLKKLRAEVHVLALSATPIPRSLQMAMSGVRDLSLIATPPVDRLAIRTFVMPFDEVVIREAILRERNRGGRVFYVAPRLADLEPLHKRLHKLVPEIKIGIAHGKLTPTELDKVMNQFFDGKFDLLLATPIVESGLDISNANTIIIHRADMFGLAQLYQLRGRVGRGKTRAYAYLTLEPRRGITDNAMKRLEVIQSLDNLGAGFSLASHDMDIRGFGNLLGDEQSGHIKEVGIELYQKMLNEAVLRAKAEAGNLKPEASSFTPDINVGASILIPEFYIADLDLRLSLYKRAAGLKDEGEIDSFRIELIDRFGRPPQEVEHLLDVLKLKLLCRAACIQKIDIGPKAIVMQFHETAKIDGEKLMNYVMANKERIKVRPDNKLVFAKDETDSFEENRDALEQNIKEILQLDAG